MDLVESAFTTKFPKADSELVFGADSQYDFGRKLAKEFVDRSGFRKLPKVSTTEVARTIIW
jgi:UDP-glucose:glycoprotein glucosyltransferase